MENSLQFFVISWIFLASFSSFTIVVGWKSQEFQNNADQSQFEVTEYHRIRKYVGANIEVSGRISFKDRAPETIPPNSQLNVRFIDILMEDAPHKEVASILVDLSNYKNTTPVFYNLTCKRPVDLHDMHSVTAVLNMGWIPKGGKNDEWLRHGDYHNTNSFIVNVTSRNDKFVRDIELEKAVLMDMNNNVREPESPSPTSAAVLCGKDVLMEISVLLTALFFPS